MLGLGWPEVGIIVLVAILIFGPKKIPELGSALGKTLKDLKEELKKPNHDTSLEKDDESSND